MPLQKLPPLGTINGVPSTDTSNPLYLPPPGYYQADDGSLVPMTTPSSTSQLGSLSPNQYAGANSPVDPVTGGSLSSGAAQSKSAPGWLQSVDSYISDHAENVIAVIIGLILIAAGVFAFKSTQTLVSTGGKVARRGLEIAAS